MFGGGLGGLGGSLFGGKEDGGGFGSSMFGGDEPKVSCSLTS